MVIVLSRLVVYVKSSARTAVADAKRRNGRIVCRTAVLNFRRTNISRDLKISIALSSRLLVIASVSINDVRMLLRIKFSRTLRYPPLFVKIFSEIIFNRLDKEVD